MIQGMGKGDAETERVCHDVLEQSIHQSLSNRGRVVTECCGSPDDRATNALATSVDTSSDETPAPKT
jgi:hypothetical protein